MGTVYRNGIAQPCADGFEKGLCEMFPNIFSLTPNPKDNFNQPLNVDLIGAPPSSEVINTIEKTIKVLDEADIPAPTEKELKAYSAPKIKEIAKEMGIEDWENKSKTQLINEILSAYELAKD